MKGMNSGRQGTASSGMEVIRMAVGPLAVNCYLAICLRTNEAILVDPGAEPDTILRTVRERNAHVKLVVLTHGHGDHIGAVREVAGALACQFGIHEADAAMLLEPELNLSAYMPDFPRIGGLSPDMTFHDGDVVRFGEVSMKVVHTPGHTRGSICLVGHGAAFTGDTLFAGGGVGRTDLPGGSDEALWNSIEDKLFSLPEDTRVLPGHGPETTIGAEQANHRFC